MTMPTVTLRQLIEAGVHFGHHTRRWNPKMAPYIFGVRNNIHIIDLEQTVPMMLRALQAVRDTVAKGGRVLFIGTKRQAQASIAESAARCGQYFVNHRWLGGMMTNWPTISQSIKHMGEYEEKLSGEDSRGYTKKERLKMQLELDKWNRSLGGIRNMGGKPDIVFVLDTNKEELAIKEAQKLGIPVVAVLDSNSNPDGITYPIPGNDDALRAINLYCDLIVEAVLDGLKEEVKRSGIDLGASAELPTEEILSDPAAAPELDAPVAIGA